MSSIILSNGFISDILSRRNVKTALNLQILKIDINGLVKATIIGLQNERWVYDGERQDAEWHDNEIRFADDSW